jgi:hypothetical protein
VERGFGLAGRDFQLFQFVGLLVGVVIWYFTHLSHPSEKEMAQCLPWLRHGQEENGGRRGEGRVSSPFTPPWDQFTSLGYLGSGHKCTDVENR